MAAPVIGSDIYIEYIRSWYAGFRKTVESFLNSDSHVYAIAISRKMPRFLDWIQKHNDSLGLNGFEELLSRIELTTEHALPFLFNNPGDFEVIVIDDSIVTGNTMRNVVAEVIAYSHGKQPYVSVIVGSDDALYNLINSHSEVVPSTKLHNEEISHWLDFVSRCNYESELPIDIVFPIFQLGNVSEKAYLEFCAESLSSDDWYELNADSNQKSINILLDKDLIELTTLEFSKARFFFGDSTAKLAVFSPHAIGNKLLSSDSPFAEEELNIIWNIIREHTSQIKEDRTAISLAVTLNYLHAINTFKRNKKLLIPSPGIEFSLNEEDLTLIFGAELARNVFALMENVAGSEYMNEFYIHRLCLPPICAPEELKEAYALQRKMIAARHIADDDRKQVVADLFSQASYNHDILGQNTSLFHRMYSSFYESFESVENLLLQYFELGDSFRFVNAAIDELIDKGKVIPKYVEVTGNDGLSYWCRYFTSAYSSVEL